MASFSVCVLARENPKVLKRVVTHYSMLGADRVRIFFDGEKDEAQVPEIEGMDLKVCDKAFWMREIGALPDDLNHAIRTVFQFAHESATSDWQFFCDADEFLVSKRPIDRLLQDLPADAEALRVMNLEAVWGPGDDTSKEFGCTYMRTPLNRKKELMLRILLPKRKRELFRRGFLGHANGKSFLRRGASIERYSSHHALRGGKALGKWAHELGWGIDQIALLHFDAVSEARWTEKWRRRVSNERNSLEMVPHRRAQSHAVSVAMKTDALRQLFHELYSITSYEAGVLRLVRGVQRQKIS